MSFFSEDSASPAAPFSGDGSVFDQPDVVLQSPATNERVVDTQSGFLLVIRRIGERLALSCKRRVGTPPSSSILLTPDESFKLSRILASSVIGVEDPHEDYGMTGRHFEFVAPAGKRGPAFLKNMPNAAVIATSAVLAAALIAGGFFAGKHAPNVAAPAVVTTADPLSAAAVDSFTRAFVSDMLDFKPETYRTSQVHALSVMAPELLEKYWKETNFPLSAQQLKTLPVGNSVVVDKITQEHRSKTTATSDVFASIVHSDKTVNPIHLRLQLGLTPAGQICVLSQEDASTPAKRP